MVYRLNKIIHIKIVINNAKIRYINYYKNIVIKPKGFEIVKSFDSN